MAVSVARLLNEYSTGLTETVILGELELQVDKKGTTGNCRCRALMFSSV